MCAAYKEEGTTTTPFDMVVLNNLDRYQLALDAIRRIPRLGDQVKSATARYWTINGTSQALHQRAWRRHARGPRLALERVSARRWDAMAARHRNLSPSRSTAAPPRSNSAFTALAPHGRTRCSRAWRNRSASQAASFRCGTRKDMPCSCKIGAHPQPTGCGDPHRQTFRTRTKCPHRQRSGTVSCMAARSSGSIA